MTGASVPARFRLHGRTPQQVHHEQRFRRPLLEGHRQRRHPRGLCALRAQDFDRGKCRAARHRPLRMRLCGRAEAAGRARQDLSELLRRIRLCRDRADPAPVRRVARGGLADLLFDRRHPLGEPPEFRRRHQAQPAAGQSQRLCDPSGVQAAGGRRGHHQAARQRVLRHAADRASDAARHPDPDRVRREHLGLRARDRGRRLFARLPGGAGGGVLLRPQPAVAQGQPVRHAPQIRRRRCTSTRWWRISTASR